MSTTSLKMSAQLKQRAAAIAKKKGVSPHAFLIGAIEAATEAEEARWRMLETARKALERTRETGTGYAADDVHRYIRSRLKGENGKKPQEKSVWQD